MVDAWPLSSRIGTGPSTWRYSFPILSLILSATNSTSRYRFRSTSSNSTGARHSTVVRSRIADFALVRDSADYVCIHDVDYMPIWTDYSWSAKPTRLIRYGLTLKEDWDNFFGAVVLFDNVAYERVNGFPNCYWGWGPEDLELGQRCRLTGLGFDARDGTYMALSHKHAGLSAPDVWTPEARRTHAVYMTRRNDIASLIAVDGVSTLKFKLLEKKPLAAGGQPVRRLFPLYRRHRRARHQRRLTFSLMDVEDGPSQCRPSPRCRLRAARSCGARPDARCWLRAATRSRR